MNNKKLEFFLKEEQFDDEIEFGETKLISSSWKEVKLEDNNEQEVAQKCGDVLLTAISGKFIFVCALCQETFWNLSLFGNHIRDKHELATDWNKSNIKNSGIEADTSEYDRKSHTDRVETTEGFYNKRDEEYATDGPSATTIQVTPTRYGTQLGDSMDEGNTQDDKETPGGMDDKKDEKEKQPFCILCNVSFSHAVSLRAHFQKKHSDLLSIDEIRSAQIASLELKLAATLGEVIPGGMYVQKDENEKQPFCPVCCSSFSQAASFRAHLQKKHSDVLNIDEIRNATVENLESKLAATLGEMTCVYCFKRFTDVDAFRIHSSTHVGRNMYNCKFCPKVFGSQYNRQAHMNIHEGVRPHKCDLCPAAYRHVSSLRNHLLVHSSDEKFICKYCNMVFARKGDRTVHERIHSNELPFKCQECGKGFITQMKLKHHMVCHEGIQTYKCDDCGSSFASLDLLEDHTPIHSKIAPVEVQRSVRPSNVFPKLEQIVTPSTFFTTSGQCAAQSAFMMPDHDQRAAESSPLSLDRTSPNKKVHYERNVEMDEPLSNIRHEIQKSNSLGKTNEEENGNLTDQSNEEGSRDIQSIELSGGEVLQKIDKERKPFCSACSRCFKRQRFFRKHLLMQHSELFTVDEVNDSNIDILEKGIAKNSGEMLCAFCFMSFSDLETFRNHSCVQIGRYTDGNFDIGSSQAQEKKHLSNRLSIDDEKDDVAGEEEPENAVKGEKMPMCILCGRCYKSNIVFRKHLRTKHSDSLTSEEIRNCSIKELEGKLAKISGELICTYCFEKFNDVEEFRTHSKLHMGDNVFKCKFCPKTFGSQFNRQIHMNIHENIRPYKCLFCSRAFANPQNCIDHERIHSDALKLPCKFCDKLFARKSEKTAHEKIHTNDFPYVCSECGMRFVTRMKLKNHVLRRKCTEYFKCQRCEKKFYSMSKLDEHMLIHSSEQPMESIAEKETLESTEHSEFEILVAKEEVESYSETEDAQQEDQINEENFQNIKESEEECKTEPTTHDANVLAGVDESKKAPFCPACIRCFRCARNFRGHLRLKHSNFLTMDEIKTCSVKALEEKVLTTLGVMVCTYCFTSFTEIDKFRTHSKSHLGKYLFVCKFCPKTFVYKQKRDLHMKTHEKVQAMLKDQQNKPPPKEREVQKDIRVGGKKPFCILCIRCYPQGYYFRKHLGRKHYDMFTLEEIENSSLEELEQKLAKIPDEMICIYCWKNFNNIDDFRVHSEIHVGRNVFCCKLCPKTFNSQYNRQMHMNIHEKLRPYKCKLCSMAFANPQNLRKHERVHAGVQKLACKFCDQVFTKSSDRIVHERKHANELPFQCDQCGVRFLTRSKLKHHVERHKGIKNYKCQQCEKAFFNLRCLKEHSLVHTNERPFKCTTCSQTFRRYRNLKGHMLLHQKVKKYVCKICSKAFAQSAGLYIHMKQHEKMHK